MLYVVPAPALWRRLTAGWDWRMPQAAFVHESNGQVDPLSRGLIRICASLEADSARLSATLRLEKALNTALDNPGI